MCIARLTKQETPEFKCKKELHGARSGDGLRSRNKSIVDMQVLGVTFCYMLPREAVESPAVKTVKT